MLRKVLWLIFITTLCFGESSISLIPEPINLDEFLVKSPDSTKISIIRDIFNKELFEPCKNTLVDIESIKAYKFQNSSPLYILHWSDRSPHSYYNFYIEDSLEIKLIGRFGFWSSTFCEVKNGFPQIVSTYFEGHKTNPIYYTSTLEFNGSKYIISQNNQMKLGDYRDKGLKAYEDSDYQTAYVCFQNVLRPVWKSAKITPVDYNNLALVYIKTHEYLKADELLHKALTLNENQDITFFNLGLLHESQKNILQAIEYYHKSNYVNPSKNIDERLKSLYNIFLEFNSFPYGFLEEMKINENVIKNISESQFEKITYLSESILAMKTIFVSEEKYLKLSEQRKIILDIKNDRNMDIVSKYILLDHLIQYYFMTYYYHFAKPGQKNFMAIDKNFIDSLGIEYKWKETAACNYYLHTYLKKILDLKDNNNRWILYYKKLYQQNRFDDYPKGD